MAGIDYSKGLLVFDHPTTEIADTLIRLGKERGLIAEPRTELTYDKPDLWFVQQTGKKMGNIYNIYCVKSNDNSWIEHRTIVSGNIPLSSTIIHLQKWMVWHGFLKENEVLQQHNSKQPEQLDDIVEVIQPLTTMDNTKAIQSPPSHPAASQPGNGSANPYDLMIADIQRRVISEVKDSLIDHSKVTEIALAEMAKTNRLVITIEDRRKSPPDVKEITEATHNMLPELVGVVKSECWAALVGATGSGKTLGVLQMARILDIGIVCVKQMTRIIAPHDLIGYMDAAGSYRKGAWTDSILGYPLGAAEYPPSVNREQSSAIIVVDEMDNANENVIMIIKALQTGQIAMPYGMQSVNPRLTVVATMNTWGTGATREYVGRCAQDAALLNEFQFIEWNYDTEFEWTLLQKLFGSYKETGDYTLLHMRQLLDMFIAMRHKVEEQKVRCIISTRNIISVAKMLICNPTWSIHPTLMKSVYKGLKEEDIKRIEAPEHWGQPKKRNIVLEPKAKKPDTSMFPGIKTTDDEDKCPI